MSHSSESSTTDNVVAFPGQVPDVFAETRRKVTNFLIERTLIDSYFAFREKELAYPFLNAREIRPGGLAGHREYAEQKTAFLVIVDGPMPRPLNKHFRLRTSNRITWRNLHRLMPDLDHAAFKADHCRLENDAAYSLLHRLLPADYALVGERLRDRRGVSGPVELRHMHVKVERLTDNAIKDLGKALGYIERRLFERGEDFVESLEAKFLEYFGFSANASGRKSAAAMAAQLLQDAGARFNVLVTGQEDRRLTILGDSDLVDQYLLVSPEMPPDGFVADPECHRSPWLQGPPEAPVWVCRVRYRRTAAARPSDEARDPRLDDPWLAVDNVCLVGRDVGRELYPVTWAMPA